MVLFLIVASGLQGSQVGSDVMNNGIDTIVALRGDSNAFPVVIYNNKAVTVDAITLAIDNKSEKIVESFKRYDMLSPDFETSKANTKLSTMIFCDYNST